MVPLTEVCSFIPSQTHREVQNCGSLWIPEDHDDDNDGVADAHDSDDDGDGVLDNDDEDRDTDGDGTPDLGESFARNRFKKGFN